MAAIQIPGSVKTTTESIINDTVTASGDGIKTGTSIYVPENSDFKNLSIPETRDPNGNVIITAQSHDEIVAGMKKNLRPVIAPIVRSLQPVSVSVFNGAPSFNVGGTTDILTSTSFEILSTRPVMVNAVIGFRSDSIDTVFTYNPYIVGNTGTVTGASYKFITNTSDIHMQVFGSWIMGLSVGTYTLYLRLNHISGGNIILDGNDVISMTLMG